MNIECCNCGKKINEEEMILVDRYNDIYCTDCFEEESITYYKVNDETIGDENDCAVFRNLQGLKENLKREINFLEKRKENFLKELEKDGGLEKNEKDKSNLYFNFRHCSDKLENLQNKYEELFS